MKWFVVSCVGVLVLGVPSATGAETLARPSLVLVGESPLVLRGSGFKANERVTVFVQAGKKWTRRAEATSSGSFAMRFPEAVSACAGVSAQAFGARGSRARLLPLARRACWPGLPDR